MFRGATKLNLDDKGRLVIPTRYREQIAERSQGRLVITVDFDNTNDFDFHRARIQGAAEEAIQEVIDAEMEGGRIDGAIAVGWDTED